MQSGFLLSPIKDKLINLFLRRFNVSEICQNSHQMPGEWIIHSDRESRRLPWPTLFQFSSSLYKSFIVHTMVSLVEAIIIVFPLSPFFSPNFAGVITPFIYSVLCSTVSFVTS